MDASEATADPETLRRRISALEQELAERTAAMHAALAAAQDRSYWLERWNVDLNALMRKPGAGLLRAALRAVRAVYRLVYDARSRTHEAGSTLSERVRSARTKLDRERVDTVTSGPAPPRGRGATPVSDAIGSELDGDDAAGLAALVRADTVVDALTAVGVNPDAGQRWICLGPGADELARVLGNAHERVRFEAVSEPLSTTEPVEGAIAIASWTADGAADRLRALGRALHAGGALVIGAEGGQGDPLTPHRLAADATPDWSLALYRPGGLESDRDLYVLRRA